MTKIDIFSGFLGAGKTTLIKKLIQEAYQGEKLVLIENEFGEIGIDGGFMKEAGITVNEMTQGCICCSLVGDFGEALQQVLDAYSPDRILIEPSGVGKLSDVIRAVLNVESDQIVLNSFTTVADANKCRVYARNFGEFYNDQLEHAGCIVLSRTSSITPEKLEAAVTAIREHNEKATLITTPWEDISSAQILAAMERTNSLEAELAKLAAMQDEEDECPVCGGHHHDCGCDHDVCECGHHHDHDAEYGCADHGEHHHHEHGKECECGHDHGEHAHHHGHHDHHHHHGHDADEIFTSWGRETAHAFTQQALTAALEALNDSARFGEVLRAKGIVAGENGWLHFDFVPGEVNVRSGAADVTGRICVIGAELNEPALAELFGLA